ncbi:MAG TPA: 6,7-dimethyl-8-ribityllumazine synthase [Gammaproteobacteria bacterium]|jgi:6,7-dimethyl-8-ribityllumazine synthase|nr:6,7-dimethyl-8-ribityllumazine synthase [Gammaproteobacteria bacterium]
MMPYRFAIIVSEFNQDITTELYQGACRGLAQAGVPASQIDVVKVPGAVEIPLAAQWMAQSTQYDAIICMGAVVRGETDHYRYVCEQVSQGCQQVMLEYNMPVIFAVLTVDNEEQAWDRLGGKEGHIGEKYAHAAIQMCELSDRIKHKIDVSNQENTIFA